MKKTDYADYLCRTWPVLTTPDDVLELGRVLENTWNLYFDDREGLERALAYLCRNPIPPKSWQQFRILRDAARLFSQRLKEMPRPQKKMGFWDL